MPYSVKVSFDRFRENIELSGDHRETAQKRRDSVVGYLKKDFTILEAFPSGSIPRYTALKSLADLDVIVVLHFGKHIEGKLPSQVLGEVQRSLSGYRTNVRRNGQAVTLYYETWPSVDIVPVSRVSDNGNFRHYNVPDMNREMWIPSNPRRHSERLTDANKKCGLLFKRIVKMIKWWNYKHSAIMQSFHVEVLALAVFSGSLGDDYSWNVFQYFDKAIEYVRNGTWYEVTCPRFMYQPE